MGADARASGLGSRLHFDTPRGRSIHLMVGVLLILGGLSLAIINAATPSTQVSSLAASGSFFALAESGNTLYAASENGGSVLLERSMDRGVDWTASPVPYSAVAGGAPWTHAAVAVEGQNLILAASTSGVAEPYNGVVPLAYSCAQNSTLLIAFSPNEGRTWSTATFDTPGLSVTSLQAGVDGTAAAVAWLGGSTSCTSSAAMVEGMTSSDSGRTWSTFQQVTAPGESIPTGEGIEMAPSDQGIVIAFGLSSVGSNGSQLGLWGFAAGSGAGFSPMGVLPAPTSWTLQGSTDTPAYLLTPTYLVPLDVPPYTALPFNQLQIDGGGIGALPRVVSVVPTGDGKLEVAATTSDNLGVDCWQVDTSQFTVARTCHVALGSTLLGSSELLPIVALIDGGGWWVAIGASGDACGYDCPLPGGPNLGPPPAASSNAAVGTSVCITGCSSAQGLAAYSFTPTSSTYQAAVTLGAGLLAGVGLLWLAVWAMARHRARRNQPSGAGGSSVPYRSLDPEWIGRDLIRRMYLGGLGAWTLIWMPLVVLTFLPGGSDASTLTWVVVASGLVGAMLAVPFHAAARLRLQALHGVTAGELLAGPLPQLPRPTFGRVQRAASYAYASWAGGIGLVLLTVVGLSFGIESSGPSSNAGTTVASASPGWIVVAALAVAFVALRGLYHYNLARAATMPARGPEETSADPTPDSATIRRTQVGSALLPLNPFVGLLLGVALQSVLPWGPYILSWAFLPLTYLGIAVLAGCFGPTTWSSPPAPITARPSPAVSSAPVAPTL